MGTGIAVYVVSDGVTQMVDHVIMNVNMEIYMRTGKGVHVKKNLILNIIRKNKYELHI
jgi:hypothetical protein